MNKLKYIKPSIEVVDIKGSVNILAGSDLGNSDFVDNDSGVGSDDNPFPGFGPNKTKSIWD
ncbi:hypothetical protein [uncultured Prevotella sp.]|uniref:hypothetical protein n=1 Tax=uncultured Prevotella sp. TaxID=159272 RepID=UPI00262BB9F6|nr:hypothetical protein [uncultured Prevotella sp.]